MKKYLFPFVTLLAAISFTTNAAEPTNYYKSCEGKTGEALLTALQAVVGPHKNVGYDGLWEVYNKSDVDENGKLWDMYSTKRWSTSSSEHCGNYKYVGDCVNREHSFPKSWFSEGQPMKSDAFHVYPTDGKVNGQRSNYPYGECANGTTLASSNGIQALGKLGTSTFPGYTGKVFEPVDEYKGDLARTYFYMAAAYKDKIGSWKSDMLAGNSYPAYNTWAVNLLLKWHRQDEVSKKETDRNDAVYSYQNNRNPFIDHPELVEYIWGDKKGQAWYINGAPVPTWATPAYDSTIDFGLTATNYSISRAIDIKGSNLTSPVSVTLTGSDFTLHQSTITAAAVNNGTTISVSFKRATSGVSTGTLTFRSGDINVTVSLRAEAISGIPALPAEDITDDSFKARWMSLGDAESYQLAVKKGGNMLSGYPVTVNAEEEEYTVTGLEPATLYTYSLTSATRVSNEVNVTTAALVPDVQYLNGNEFTFAVEPDTNSEPVEIWIDVENIDRDLTVSVNAPFALSTDPNNWSRTITIDPMEDRFYLRVEATAMGEYESTITITDGYYVNDDATATASVRDMSEPWFVEDFEKAESKHATYNNQTFEGNPCTWHLTNAGLWSSDKAHNGIYALRMGKNSTSALETDAPKTGGIGKVSFHAERWSASDGNMVLQVEYRPEKSDEWVNAGTVTVSSDSYAPYEVPVNVNGSNYLRLRQTEGARGLIDDIVVTDHNTTGIDAIEDDTLADWDAYCINKALVIVNHGEAAVYHVYNLDGQTVGGAKLHNSQYTVALPAGLYIVTDGTNSRRVLVK
ncbi:MAG: endonuclease [Muribaculaceae bacterium]|nr:endonuclease [Muribaculaceae bacterium]